uniref:Uncharacterized protein n=1 Tax=Arundo donax TaxID=35708 RepID=A0A0A9II72_ARUDO
MHPSNLPVEAPSIQLFGITITPHVEKSATDGASDEVNEVPNGVLDENVEGDV